MIIAYPWNKSVSLLIKLPVFYTCVCAHTRRDREKENELINIGKVFIPKINGLVDMAARTYEGYCAKYVPRQESGETVKDRETHPVSKCTEVYWSPILHCLKRQLQIWKGGKLE